MNRRFFLLAAPAIVAAPSLMKVSAAVLDMLAPAETMAVDSAPYYGFETLLQTTLRNRSHLFAEQIMRNNAILKHMRDAKLMIGPVERHVKIEGVFATFEPKGRI